MAAPLIFDHAGDFMQTILNLGFKEKSNSDSYNYPEDHSSSSWGMLSGILDFRFAAAFLILSFDINFHTLFFLNFISGRNGDGEN